MLAPDADHERGADSAHRPSQYGNRKRSLGTQSTVSNSRGFIHPAEHGEEVPMRRLLKQHLQRDGHQDNRRPSDDSDDVLLRLAKAADEKEHAENVVNHP